MNKPTFKHICLMHIQQLTNFPYIEKDFDALTDYGLLCKVVDYLNQVIANENAQNDNILALYNAFNTLKNYVDNYFDTLDVQDEVNNKLDEMLEDGTLEEIIGSYIYSNILGDLNFREINEYKASTTDLYQGYSHAQLQGFCKTGTNTLIMALRNPYSADNYVKLIEYNYKTSSVVRYAYLTLNHCNSITFDETNQKLYAASLSKKEDDEVVEDNTLFKIDYTTLSIEEEIEISNLSGERLRSVFYDNNTNILYGGNSNTIFKINLSTNTISDTVTLDTTYLQPNSINQVLKYYKGYYVSLNISNIVFYNSDGSVFRSINIDRIQDNLAIGEPQDFILEENGDLILGSTKRLNDYLGYLSTTFYYSNIYTNTNNIVRNTIGGDTSRYLEVYCNNSGDNSYEDGSNYSPFKTLQKAINFISNSTRTCVLHLSGGTYDTEVMIRGINNLDIILDTNVTLNGLIIYNSNVNIKPNGKTLVLNGIKLDTSNLIVIGESSNHVTFNYMNSNNFSDYCIYAETSKIYMRYVDFVGSNNHDMVEVLNNSELTLDSCTFTNYTSYLPIRGQNQCKINLKGNTFNTASSSSQHLIQLRYSCILNSQNDLTSINDYDKDIYSKVYGVRVIETLPATIYYGDVCATHKEYQFAKAKSTVANLNNTYLYTDFKTKNAQNDRYMITSVWGNNVNIKNVLADFRCYNDKITIMDNRRIVLDGSTYTYTALDSQPESATGDYVGIVAIEYYD